jgi:hypothetical protein
VGIGLSGECKPSTRGADRTRLRARPHLRRDWAHPLPATSAPGLGSAHFRPHLGSPPPPLRYVRAADAAVVAVDVRGAQLLGLLQALLNAPPHGLQVGGRYGRIMLRVRGFGIRGWADRNKGRGCRNKGRGCR